VVSNHLTNGLLHYIHTTGRFASGVNLFEKLRSKEPEVASLLAKVYLDGDEEVKAVSLLYDTIKILPMDAGCLDVQAQFCMSKGRHVLALECAKRAVNSAPSEFITWARLAEVYVALEQWELVGVCLNATPLMEDELTNDVGFIDYKLLPNVYQSRHRPAEDASAWANAPSYLSRSCS